MPPRLDLKEPAMSLRDVSVTKYVLCILLYTFWPYSPYTNALSIIYLTRELLKRHHRPLTTFYSFFYHTYALSPTILFNF